MGRTHLPADGGMLFVFERPGRHCFWMRDTPLPLSIAFIDAAGRIVSLADMQPRSETLHCPGTDVRYALEVRQGEFQRRGIALHAQVDGLPRVTLRARSTAPRAPSSLPESSLRSTRTGR